MTVAQLKNDIATEEPGLVEHPTSKRIYEACAFAHEKRALVVIHGGAGVGKTTTLSRYESDHWQSAYHVNLHLVKTPMAMLEAIAERAYPAAVASGYRQATIRRALVEHFRRQQGPGTFAR